MIFTRQLRTLLHLGIGGIGHDAVELHDTLAGGVQNAHDLIIHAIALDGAAAVGQHDGFPVVPQQTAEVLFHAALAKIHLGLVFKNKVVHIRSSFRFFCPYYKKSETSSEVSLCSSVYTFGL